MSRAPRGGRRAALVRALWGLALLVLAMGAAGYWWLERPPPQASVEVRTLEDGARLVVANPPGAVTARVVVAATARERLDPARLESLAERTDARLVEFELVSDGSCADQRRRFAQASEALGGEPTVVAGIGPAATFAYRWLAEQRSDSSQALSAGLDVEHGDCAEPLPAQAPHGVWNIVWNNGVEDATGLFVRGLEHTQVRTTIGDYAADLPTLAAEQLQAMLIGARADLPVIELPSAQVEGGSGAHGDTVTLYYSGDGGWRDLDKVTGEYLAAHGYPVVGVDTLKLFWQHRSPEQSAADLAQLMQRYREKWGARHFVLAGYSFGADIMPALYNRLSAEDQAAVSSIILIAFSDTADFEIAVEGWLGAKGSETRTGPELARIAPDKIACIFGEEEAGDSGCNQPGAVGEKIGLPGGHHFDQDYDRLAQVMIAAIDKRRAQ
ncbi:virulence factor family protein [Halotalea alkalilenta]|uniref:Bacterial virulence domain-containing protein n=1 Tax=Halotalea alkalilenta TaxID=376489 RepID=A0A172YFQ2_9GAMM|nr:AcvB/VirJ family lysyl-phosphatidylglycerol hydrolase [Halotalea alkalilenta]ANF57936.1 hypothetical protein A5892_11070 [Halotalea alkalilenta]